jgi:hypothetical protein
MKFTELANSVHLVVRKDGVLCTRCGTTDPVHPGDGTPLPSFVLGLAGCAERHPPSGECNA